MNSKMSDFKFFSLGKSFDHFLHSFMPLMHYFLSCNPESYNLKSPWVTMLYNLNLNDILRSTISSGACSKVPRSIVFHSIYNLGYNCVHCCIPLTGPLGFFACTNLCTHCSLKTLKETNSRIYVDGSVR